jgi:hypothetical protein
MKEVIKLCSNRRFNVIQIIQCVRKVAVHLQMVTEIRVHERLYRTEHV